MVMYVGSACATLVIIGLVLTLPFELKTWLMCVSASGCLVTVSACFSRVVSQSHFQAVP